MRITILGLGPGDPGLLTREAWKALQQTDEIYLRTRDHPVVSGIPKALEIRSFDAVYTEATDYEAVYETIVQEVLELGQRPSGVLYAVPGHPFIGEATAPEIVLRARQQGIPVRVIAGLSFLEPTLAALGKDLLPRATLVDAFELARAHHPTFPPDAPAVVAQLYSNALAAEVKLTLMEVFPDGHRVQLVHAAGTSMHKVEDLRLFEIDRSDAVGSLTSLYVPPLGPATSFEAFQDIIAHLRAPDGCPWDREQTHLSLRPYLLEETYETLGALDAEDSDALQEELGDLLIQIVLHAQIAAEKGEFKMADVLRQVHEKLVRRHPHVFAGLEVADSREVKHNWEQLKAAERNAKGAGAPSVLLGVPAALPALAQAAAYQRRVVRVGFDWPDIRGVLGKVREEITELEDAKETAAQAAEIGDLLFAVVNLARWHDIDAETALREANERFRQRFTRLEGFAREKGRTLEELTLEEMDLLWERSKSLGDALSN